MSFALGNLFTDPIHAPFHLDGGDPAVLLVHGFPGTPAELRDIAGRLQQGGAAARGVLLPGFGPQFAHLFDHSPEDWVDAVVGEIGFLRKTHAQVVVLGYSFGGAVALHAAGRTPVDGVVLAAPFWQLGGGRERLFWGALKRIFPTIRPFRDLDFSKPDVQAGIGKLLPGIDLGSAEVQAALRELRVPASFVDAVMSMGAGARRSAEKLRAPVLILQGSEDDVIEVGLTRELAAAFPIPPAFHLLRTGHDLLSSASEEADRTAQLVLDFLAQIAASRPAA